MYSKALLTMGPLGRHVSQPFNHQQLYTSKKMATHNLRCPRGFRYCQAKVSLLGVDSLWSDCTFIPVDWGS